MSSVARLRVVRKRGVDELALLGGLPAFTTPLHVGRPAVGNLESFRRRLDRVLTDRWFTNGGPFVEELEERVASHLSVRHCIATASGTAGLEIAARALDLTGEVIIPSFTFIATAHALRWVGLTPVFCDISSDYTLDPAAAERLVGPQTSAILATHVWGWPCNVRELSRVARRHHLKLVFDAAHAFGCAYGGRPLGSFGDAAVLSFHATKIVNGIEAGAIVTDDDELAERARLMRNFGFRDYDDVAMLGTNGKLSEVHAAMALTSLESLEELVAVNRRNWHAYRESLSHISGITLLERAETEDSSYQYVVVDVDESVLGLTRDEVHEVLTAEGVLARRYFFPGCHSVEPYRSETPDVGSRLPQTEEAVRRVLSLPTGDEVTPAAIEVIRSILEVASESAAVVRAKLRSRT